MSRSSSYEYFEIFLTMFETDLDCNGVINVSATVSTSPVPVVQLWLLLMWTHVQNLAPAHQCWVNSDSLCMMEVFQSLLLLLSAWTAQETFCRSLNNSTGNGGIRIRPASEEEFGEEESKMMHHPGLAKKMFFCDKRYAFLNKTKIYCLPLKWWALFHKFGIFIQTSQKAQKCWNSIFNRNSNCQSKS